MTISTSPRLHASIIMGCAFVIPIAVLFSFILIGIGVFDSSIVRTVAGLSIYGLGGGSPLLWGCFEIALCKNYFRNLGLIAFLSVAPFFFYGVILGLFNKIKPSLSKSYIWNIAWKFLIMVSVVMLIGIAQAVSHDS